METYQDNKCPRIIIHERSKGSDDESDDDEDRYSVTSWRKNFSSLSSFSSKNKLQNRIRHFYKNSESNFVNAVLLSNDLPDGNLIFSLAFSGTVNAFDWGAFTPVVLKGTKDRY